MPIVINSDDHILAINAAVDRPLVETVIIDQKRSTDLWTKAADGPIGLAGQLYYLECR
jgi:hypothetical protein